MFARYLILVVVTAGFAVGQSPGRLYIDKEEMPEPQAVNSNPNYAAIREYGRIEWHGDTASLVAAGSRPLFMAALTLSTCLGVSVSAEEPRYRYFGDLLDVTAPQWLAKHPDRHAYAGKPAKVNVSFVIDSKGLPVDLPALLQDTATEVNVQQPFTFQVRTRTEQSRSFYSFVPTQTHDENGKLTDAQAYLDERISIPRQTATIYKLLQEMTQALINATGFHFSCCQMMGMQWWGGESLTFEANNETVRNVLVDLLANTGELRSYSQTCQPMDERFCFIEVTRDVNRATNSLGHVCTALGYGGY